MNNQQIQVALTRPITESCVVAVQGDPEKINLDEAANAALDAIYEGEIGDINWQTDDNSEGDTHATEYRIYDPIAGEWGKWIEIKPKADSTDAGQNQ